MMDDIMMGNVSSRNQESKFSLQCPGALELGKRSSDLAMMSVMRSFCINLLAVTI